MICIKQVSVSLFYAYLIYSYIYIDDHSIEIIDSLIIAKVRILILVSYRDQEITPKLGEMLEKEASCIEFIKVDALDTDSMVDFLCDTLHRPRDEDRQDVVPLAEIIIKKTAGNAFYTAQLLRTLERKKLIFFNWERNEWDFDLEKIQDGTSYSVQANMQLDVSFMVARLKELSRDSQQVLKWASFVGDTFSWTTVKTLIQSSDAADDSSISSDGNTLPDTMTLDDDGSVSTDVGSVETVVDASSAMRALSIGQQQRSHQRPTHTTSRATSSTTATTLSDPMNGLQSVLQEGYIMPLGDDEFKWSHDRITQAAGELASPKARSRIHLAIAQHMMKGKPFTHIKLVHITNNGSFSTRKRHRHLSYCRSSLEMSQSIGWNERQRAISQSLDRGWQQGSYIRCSSYGVRFLQHCH